MSDPEDLHNEIIEIKMRLDCLEKTMSKLLDTLSYVAGNMNVINIIEDKFHQENLEINCEP